jgi:hypothetical protein
MEQNLPFTLEHNGAYMLDAFADKFAELIVRECLNVMSKTSEEANKRFTYMGDDVPTVVHQMNIEKHFGVEE